MEILQIPISASGKTASLFGGKLQIKDLDAKNSTKTQTNSNHPDSVRVRVSVRGKPTKLLGTKR